MVHAPGIYDHCARARRLELESSGHPRLDLMFGFDATDWFILGFVMVAGVYLWVHPSDVNFATWCGLSAAFHLLRVYDQKRPDA
jgi:hypothetical protein